MTDDGVTYKRRRTGPLHTGYFNLIGLPGVQKERDGVQVDDSWNREQIKFNGDASQLYYPPDFITVTGDDVYIRAKRADDTYSTRKIGSLTLDGKTFKSLDIEGNVNIGDPSSTDRHEHLQKIITDLKSDTRHIFPYSGDGVTDYTIEINDFIEQQGGVIFLPGTYMVTGSIKMLSNTFIQGVGRGKSVLKKLIIDPTQPQTRFDMIVHGESPLNNVVIRDIGMDGSASVYSTVSEPADPNDRAYGDMMRIQPVEGGNLAICDNHLFDFKYPHPLSGNEPRNRCSGFDLARFFDVIISGNLVENGGEEIFYQGAYLNLRRATIVNNTFRDIDGIGIKGQDCNLLTATNNFFSDNGKQSFFFEHCSFLNISHNTMLMQRYATNAISFYRENNFVICSHNIIDGFYVCREAFRYRGGKHREPPGNSRDAYSGLVSDQATSETAEAGGGTFVADGNIIYNLYAGDDRSRVFWVKGSGGLVTIQNNQLYQDSNTSSSGKFEFFQCVDEMPGLVLTMIGNIAKFENTGTGGAVIATSLTDTGNAPQFVKNGQAVVRDNVFIGDWREGNIPTSDAGRAMGSVKDFGVTGDGVFDDSDAIQRAVDNGRDYFPPGIYKISRSIILRNKGPGIRGAGSRQTEFVRASGMTTAVFARSGDVSESVFSGFSINSGGNGGTTEALMDFPVGKYVTIADLLFRGAEGLAAIKLSGSIGQFVDIRDCSIDGSASLPKGVVYLTGGLNRCNISRNNVNLVKGPFLWCDQGCKDIFVTDNIITPDASSNADLQQIIMQDCERVTIARNMIRNAVGSGMTINLTNIKDHTRVCDNDLINFGKVGIRLAGCPNAHISGNTLDHSSADDETRCIRVEGGCTNVSVLDNTIIGGDGNAPRYLQFHSGSVGGAVTIIGNRFVNTGTAGDGYAIVGDDITGPLHVSGNVFEGSFARTVTRGPYQRNEQSYVERSELNLDTIVRQSELDNLVLPQLDVTGSVDIGDPNGSNRHIDLPQIISTLKAFAKAEIVDTMRKVTKFIPSMGYILIFTGHIDVVNETVSGTYQHGTSGLPVNLGEGVFGGGTVYDGPRVFFENGYANSIPYVGIRYKEDRTDQVSTATTSSYHLSVTIPNPPADWSVEVVDAPLTDFSDVQLRLKDNSDGSYFAKDTMDIVIHFKARSSLYEITQPQYTARVNYQFDGTDYPTWKEV